MGIYENGQKTTLYQGDYAPAEMYADGKKVAGFVAQEFAGREVSAEGTYRDVLDLTLKGQHSQVQYQGNQLIDIEHPQVNASNTAYEASKEMVWFSTEANYAGIKYTVPVKLNTTYYFKTYMYSDAGDNSPHVAISEYHGDTRVKDNTIIYNFVSDDKLVSFTTQAETDTVILFFRNRVASSVCHFEKPILSTAMANYEPYVGGMPSPNPLYPQEIVPLAEQDAYVRSINYCPNISEWSLLNGAYIDDEGYIFLPDENSRARILIPWQTDGYRLSVHADVQKLSENDDKYLLNTEYYDRNMVRISANGNATTITADTRRYFKAFGSDSDSSIYAIAMTV